jgi:hypothetical protein
MLVNHRKSMVRAEGDLPLIGDLERIENYDKLNGSRLVFVVGLWRHSPCCFMSVDKSLHPFLAFVFQ